MRARRSRRAVALGASLALVTAMSGGVHATARAALPDGRAYELVSPVEKNGGDVVAGTARTRSADDGNAVGFTSLTGFADVQGTSIASEYVSARKGTPGTSGWATHSITPKQPAMTFVGTLSLSDPLFVGDFSGDLSRGVYRAWMPLTSAPNVVNVQNLYLGTTLTSSGPWTPQLLTDAATLLSPATTLPSYAGADEEFEHLIFETTLRLTADAPASGTKLYESTGGTVRLAGVMPDGTPAPGGSQTGLGATQRRYTDRMISNDGSRIFFRAVSGSNLYVRIDGTATEQINVSEKTTPEGPQGGSLWTASLDGERVFFTTAEGLVDGDDDSQTDLYMADLSAPAGRRLEIVSADSEPGDGEGETASVIGASEDGRYVYFVHFGQLVPGEETSVARGLYLWHDGVIRYIGRFEVAGDPALNGPDASWGFVFQQRSGRVTPDGRTLLFTAHSDVGFAGRPGFSGYDHGTTCTFEVSTGGPCRQMYVYSEDSGRLACASCNPTGATATADALVQVRDGQSGANTTWHLSHALSNDGRWVFFSTREGLVPEDLNGKSDAYVYDVPAGRARLLSTGRSQAHSYFLEASPSGRDVFFITAERLVGWDNDGNYDLYDARVGGGMPEPPVQAPPCAGDMCLGPPAVGLAVTTAGSSGFRGAGDAGETLRRRAKKPRLCRRHGGRRAQRRRRCTHRRAGSRSQRRAK